MAEVRLPMAAVDKNGHQFGEWHEETGEPVVFTFHEISGQVFVSAISLSGSCQACDEWLSFEAVDGRHVRVPTPCSFSEGAVTEVEVVFASGRLLVDDDLRPIFHAEKGNLSLNSLSGQKRYVERMAESGCAYGPVLNTCPHLYRDRAGRLFVARVPYNELAGPDEPEYLLPEGWEELAWICTDLWAYSLADYEVWLERGGKPVEEDDQHGTRVVVEVKPGTYRLRHYTTKSDFDWDADLTIYGELEWLGEATK